ncbi:uncharacterized protein LOC119161804 isoform X3 [Rhipicephalus microplus]|uniref:uncharacterized protein LOC119161804 isoform X3 n=1 Tax=Rhipicephalus microplus TaxID=6941 RepID=UPI003F6BDA91
MSDWSDSSEAHVSDVKPEYFFFKFPDDKANKKARTKKKKAPCGTWYYNLSEKERRAEDKRIARELAHVEAEFCEIEKFEITYMPIEYRTRGSSLSPRTPPPRSSQEPSKSPHSPKPSTRETGLLESLHAVQPQRQVALRETNGMVVSSFDDEGVQTIRRSRQRIVSNSDYDDAASPPSTFKRSVADRRRLSEDADQSNSRVAQILKDREMSAALLHCISEEDVRDERDAECPPSSLTKADIIQRRRTRIQKHKNIELVSSGICSSRDEAKPKRSLLQTSVETPKSRRISGRYSSKMLWTGAPRATSLKSGSSSESARASSEERKDRPSFYLSSAASSFTDVPVRGAKMPAATWHSTPHSTPRRLIPLRDTSAAHATQHTAGMLVGKAASVDRMQHVGRDLLYQVLNRGETLVLTKLAEPVLGSRLRSSQPPSKLLGAAPSPVPQAVTSGTRPPKASGRHDDSATSRTSVCPADRSTLIRIGIGDNRERVLCSDASSASSAIASFCSSVGSHTSQAAKQAWTDQVEETAVTYSDSQPVDLTQQLLEICEQETAVTFEVALRIRDDCLKCRKLGEGCTADVYLLQRPSGEESAVKVIPVGRERNMYGELPMPLASIIAEGVITRIYFVQGTYHPVLAQSWTEYNLQWFSENSDPSNFEETQFYVLLEFENGGKTLERFKGTIEQLESIFLQVACSLAVAELELEFEHRDLHCDNVLVKRTEQDCVEFMLNGRKMLVRTAGVKASIIDYTLSRMRKGRNVVYTDVSDDTALFKGIGSSQYDVYRIMKDENGDDWEAYHPRTNALWLSYLLQKLTNKLPRTKQVAKGFTSGGRLASWTDAVLALPSAEAFVVEHVALQPKRKAEALTKKRRWERPQNKEPDARSARTRYALR